jgi:hypothetical protein
VLEPEVKKRAETEATPDLVKVVPTWGTLPCPMSIAEGIFTIAPTIKPKGGFFTRPEMGQDIRSRLVRRDVLASQTPRFYFAPGDTNVFTGPTTVVRSRLDFATAWKVDYQAR